MMKSLFRRVVRLGAVSVMILSGGVAMAQSVPGQQAPVRRADYDALFQQVLRDPANLDLSFRFAALATELGDYEAAIGALERMIFYNPGLSRVRLELGVLYFRLGAYQMSRSYFDGVLNAPDVPSDVRTRVQGFLFEIDRRMATTQWSVFAQVGMRYQTNANAGPTSALVSVVGRNAVLDRQSTRRDDWNAFALTSIRHVYDLGTQRGDVWETSLLGYYASQAKIARLNLGLLEVQTGPRFALAPEVLPGLSIRPYLLANGVSLGDESYLGTWGGGVSLTIPASTYVQFEPFIEARVRNFNDTPDYPFAREQSGRLVTAGVFATGPVWGPALRWQTRLAVSHNDARRDYYSYNQISFDAGLPFEFEGPFGGSRKWAFVPTFGLSRTDYEDPNPLIDPVRSRRDDEWRVGAVLDAQLTQYLGVSTQVQYAVTDSTLRNYDTRNLSITFGPTVRF